MGNDIAMQYFRKNISIQQKQDLSPVTMADKKIEEFLRHEIARHFPTHSIFGEEQGYSDNDSPYIWVIDPIDGTKSFITGAPLFGMLIGLLKDDIPIMGAINMPALGEVFLALKDKENNELCGAWHNGNRIQTSATTDIKDAIISIGEGNLFIDKKPDILKNISANAKYYRFNNDCYYYGLLAAGHIDGIIEFDLQPYDYLPIVPIIEQAGGCITTWQGDALSMHSNGSVVASATKKLHDQMLDILNISD
jgi:inositol-phosphate phosphatase/L-galactose 1-phosphate phosphatase/histidinol-phosphatase